MSRLSLLAAVLALLVTPVHAQDEKAAGLEAGAIALIDQMDWNAATVVEVVLSEHNYSPRDLVLERNKPYILRLNNVGAISHDMVGGSFFGGIAIKMAQNRGGRIVTPVLRSIYVKSRQQMEIWFVPVRAGTYTFFCSLGDHREEGMEGEIQIK